MFLLEKLMQVFFWPGTIITAALGIDPESEFGLLRSMFNALIWTTLGLGILFLVMF